MSFPCYNAELVNSRTVPNSPSPDLAVSVLVLLIVFVVGGCFLGIFGVFVCFLMRTILLTSVALKSATENHKS